MAKLTFTIATGVLITFASCKEKDNTHLNTGVATFQIDTFVAKVSAVMNAQELGTILAYLLHDKNETLLSKERTEELINLRLGLLESPTGKYGVYPSKGGTRGPDDNDRAIRSRIMIFPNNVEAVLLTNCDFQQIGSALWQNYDDSHVIP